MYDIQYMKSIKLLKIKTNLVNHVKEKKLPTDNKKDSREGKTTQTIGRDKDNIVDQTQIWTDTDKSVHTSPAMWTRNMKGRKYIKLYAHQTIRLYTISVFFPYK